MNSDRWQVNRTNRSFGKVNTRILCPVDQLYPRCPVGDEKYETLEST
jgi:hypothetical protein